MVESVIPSVYSYLSLELSFNTYRLFIMGAVKNYRKNLALSNISVQNPRSMYLWAWWDSYGDLFSTIDTQVGEKWKNAVYYVYFVPKSPYNSLRSLPAVTAYLYPNPQYEARKGDPQLCPEEKYNCWRGFSIDHIPVKRKCPTLGAFCHHFVRICPNYVSLSIATVVCVEVKRDFAFTNSGPCFRNPWAWYWMSLSILMPFVRPSSSSLSFKKSPNDL